jgi:hypothetical protein
VLSNILVDLVKLSKSFSDQEILNSLNLSFKTSVIKPSEQTETPKVSSYIKERLLNLIKSSDEIDSTEANTFIIAIRKLVKSQFLNRIDIAQMKFALEKENLLNNGRDSIFQKLNDS